MTQANSTYSTGADIINNQDPQFVDAANNDFRLLACSPALDTGTEIDAPDTDILGISRPQGMGIDMGAYEGSFGECSSCTISALAIDENTISDCQAGAAFSTFTADVTVTFSDAPATGTLDLTGGGTVSVDVSMLGSTTSHTFTGVTMTADGGAIELTASFSEDSNCTFNNANAGTAPVDCSCEDLVVSDIVSSLNRPTGVWGDGDGNLFVTEYDGHKVKKISLSNNATSEIASGLDNLNDVWGDDKGNLFVVGSSDDFIGKVTKIDLNDDNTTSVIAQGLSHPGGIWGDSKGNLFITQDGNKVTKIDLNDNNAPSEIVSGLLNPTGIWGDGKGNLFVLGQSSLRVTKIDLNDNNATSIIAQGFRGPTGIWGDGKGNLFVVAHSWDKVTKIDLNDNNATSNIAQGLSNPRGVWGDDKGNLFVTQSEENKVSKIECATAPTALTATDFLPNSAKLDWMDNCEESGSWEIEYGETGFTQGSGETVMVTNKPYALEDLDPNIVYDYYVRATCAGETNPTAWSEKLTFRTTPALKIFDASQIEGDDGSTTLDFTVLLSSAFHSDLRVAYHSQDFTATAGVDYQAVQDTLTITAGSLAATISVTINGDETPELNEIFYLAASIVPFNIFVSSVTPILEDGLALGYILDDDFEINAEGSSSIIQSCGNEVVLNATPTAGVQVGNWSVLHSTTTAGSFTSRNSSSTTYTGNTGTTDSLVWTISVNNDTLLQDTLILIISPDSDNDGVQDCVDLCLGGDDRQDADGDGSPDDCDCNANDPTDSFLFVENDNAGGNAIDNSSYESSNRLISKGTVLDGTDVTFRAGQLITLLPGFEVQAGATFLAQIGPCQNPSGTLIEELPATARADNATVETPTPIVAPMELTIQPNPASYEALIQLTLAEPDNVRLTLFNKNGQQLKTLLSGNLIEGINNYRLQLGYLPDGLYFIQAVSANNVKVQKLVVQR